MNIHVEEEYANEGPWSLGFINFMVNLQCFPPRSFLQSFKHSTHTTGASFATMTSAIPVCTDYFKSMSSIFNCLLNCRPVYSATLQMAPLHIPTIISKNPVKQTGLLFPIQIFSAFISLREWAPSGPGMESQDPNITLVVLSSPPASNWWRHLGGSSSSVSLRSSLLSHNLPS